MIDLTKITTPFGLLDDETQEALIAHDGPWEYWNGEEWEQTLMPSWQRGWAYRVKPAPQKPREWWAVGQHLRDTKEEAEAFLAQLREEHPALFDGWEVIHVREVIE